MGQKQFEKISTENVYKMIKNIILFWDYSEKNLP